MDTLFTVIFILILAFSLYSVIMAFYKKSKYKTWMNSINCVGQIKSIEKISNKNVKLSFIARFSGSDIPLSMVINAKKFKALNLNIDSYMPLIYNEETGETRNEEYLKAEYKKHFYHSWVFFLLFCILFILFIEFIGGALSETEFYKYIANYEEFRS